jgi:ribose transport system substrate-binding protein
MNGMRILGFAASACLAVMLISCGGAGKASMQSATQVGVELPLLTSPFWQAYDAYLSRDAKRYDVQLLPPANANGDTSKFLTDVQNMITEGVEGLILSPTDTAAVATSLARARQAKIPVVSVDVAPDAGNVFMVVRADNKAYGEKACDFIGTHVKSGKVVQIEGDLASINGRDRTTAFDACMKQKYTGLEVLEIAAQWDGERAAQGLEALLTANPDVKGIYMQAGGVYLSPTLSVLRRHNLLFPPTDPRHIVVVSNDGIPQELDAIRKGWIDATVSQPADAYAKYGLYYIHAAIDGKTFQPGPTDHGSTIVRLPNGALEDQLPAPLITKSNVDSAAFWGNSVKS